MFDYAVPAGLQQSVARGARVLVPFGNRVLTGVVVGLGEGPGQHPAEGLKEVRDVLDDVPAVPPELLELCAWIAGYYHCGPGESLRAALPAGIEVESVRTVEPVVLPPSERAAGLAGLGETGVSILEAVEAGDGISVESLRRDLSGFSSSTLGTLERRGLVTVRTALRKPRVRVKVARNVSFADPDTPVDELIAGLRGEKQKQIVRILAGLREDGDYPALRTRLLELADSSSTSLKGLVDKGLLQEEEQEVSRHASPSDTAGSSNRVRMGVTLHEEQQQALDAIAGAIADRRYCTYLLHGITGSGKTEVYIRALKAALDRGRTGIILVPEIALTPQTVSRFTAHFGDAIAVLHSRMAPGERYDSWRHIREGRHRIVIGPRSAILAPLENVGLIVVDEEHEQSYKQFDPAPRYHARDVAVVRARLNNAVCVLGSATPSLESYANARADKYGYLEMRRRAPAADGVEASLPTVHVVDLTKEKKRGRLEGILSGALRSAIASRLRNNEQTILLQNRRGYAPTIECSSCGWAPVCPDCSVSMTFHKASRSLRCHYCGRTDRYPNTCPVCASRALISLGVGTQRVEEELTSLFPQARVLRMDFDTTSRKNAHHGILARFGRGDADILLGTQMVAKGLDFERVTLVGVVDADTGLLFPDFRAEERTFQLLTQVAGRAGRGDRDGDVYLQTRNAGSPAITYAIAHDYDGFADYALGSRHALSYPPFGRIVAVHFRGPDEDRVGGLALEWSGALHAADSALTVLGPHPAFVSRVRNQYRYVAIVKVPQRFGQERLHAALKEAGAVRAPSGYFVMIDVDAMGLF